MTPFRIGYNIDCQNAGSNRQGVVDAQIDLHSTYTLLLDDHKDDKWFFARQIFKRSPETIIIHRAYMNGRDGDLWEAPSGDSPTGFLDAPNYLNFLQGLNSPVPVYHQVLCEPDVHRTDKDPTGERLKAKVKWLCDVIKEASKRGVKLCVDNVQTVTLDVTELEAGYYDPLWFTLSQHPEHLYGVHAYWLGDAWLNTTEARMQFLNVNGAVNAYQFIDKPDAELKADYIAQPDKAHVGREEIIARRCRKIGAKIPRMVYTEFGVDNVRLSQQPVVKDINGREPMGFPTMWRYWTIHYPQWSAAQAFGEMFKWANRAMPDYIVGACIFGYDTKFEGGTYHVENEAFQKWLSDYSATVRAGTSTPPKPPPVVSLPPTIPPLPVRDWRAELADDERTVLSLAKSGQLGALERAMLHMANILDELTGHEGHE